MKVCKHVARTKRPDASGNYSIAYQHSEESLILPPLCKKLSAQ